MMCCSVIRPCSELLLLRQTRPRAPVSLSKRNASCVCPPPEIAASLVPTSQAHPCANDSACAGSDVGFGFARSPPPSRNSPSTRALRRCEETVEHLPPLTSHVSRYRIRQDHCECIQA